MNENQIPAGKYDAWITASHVLEFTDGSGKYILFRWEIISRGKYYGKRLVDRLAVDCNDDKTTTEAREKYSLLCHCVGILQIKSTAELEYKPVIIEVNRFEQITRYLPCGLLDCPKGIDLKAEANVRDSPRPAQDPDQRHPWQPPT